MEVNRIVLYLPYISVMGRNSPTLTSTHYIFNLLFNIITSSTPEAGFV